jgi:hypothetical protein
VRISNPLNNASLYYKSSEGIWRDTTPTLLVSDTASMLANYATKAYADTSGRFYARQDFTNVSSSTLTWTQTDTLVPAGVNVVQVYRNGQILLPTQYTIPTNASVVIGATAFKLGENYTVIFPKGGGGSGGGGGSSFDTTTLNLQARLDLKLNISDTASMLANYATKAYADTSGRFYARQDFRNVSSSTLTWTQTDTLVVNDTTSLQVYRNGQILLPSQYTVPTNASVVIGATAYKLGENYTVILPRGGGGGGSGSGSLTSISGGTGITVSPNPITTTGTVSADLSVLMELTDTTLLNLTTRFATKQNNITLTTTGTSGAATLTGATLNIPQYSGGGTGTVTSVGSGYGLLGGPITTTGTLRVDTSTVYDFVRDSIVAVEIGGDTIKIIKQEYENVTSDTLTFTILPKFPIQLRQFILLFRNGQLLLNDQFSVIDTNKVKVAATSFKVGENYTLVTVSGIGSVSSGQGNPIYPEAGIALSTGTTWTTSITNNSSNWNTAYTDRLKWDGGSTDLIAATGRTSLGGTTVGQSMFTLTNPSAITFPQFNADNSVTALSAASFRSAIGGGTVTSVTVSGTAGNPLSITNTTTTPVIELLSATSARNGYLTSTDWTTFNNKQPQLSGTGFVKASGTSISYDNSTYLTTSSAASTYLPLTGGTLSSNLIVNGTTTLTGNVAINTTTAYKPLEVWSNSNDYVSVGVRSLSGGQFSGIHFGYVEGNDTYRKSAIVFQRTDYGLGDASGKIHFLNVSPALGSTSANLSYARMTINSNGNVGVNDTLPSSTLSVNGTLGVTGAATLTNLAGSGTRMVTASSAGLLSTQSIANGTVTSVSGTGAISVATGTTTPVISVADAAFGTAGIISAGTQQFSGDKTFEGITQFNGRALFKDYTYTATRLAGLSSTDRFATVTIGTGLSLASGTLSATGGGVTSVTASTPLSSSGGATPNITVADAGASASGVVNTTTQSFAGNKTFTGNVVMQNDIDNRLGYLRRDIKKIQSSTYTVLDSDSWIMVNNSAGTTTITLPTPSDFTGRELFIKTTQNQAVVSNTSNVVGLLATISTGTSILDATDGKWATLVSDGTYWIIMQAN